jgi:putative N6-adenine-specific DNA methylase
MEVHRYFATCGRGIEPILAEELHRLGAVDVAGGRGGVSFAGDRALLYRANLWLRTAVRVLWPILEADVQSPDELYEAVRGVDWSGWLTPEHTLAVDCNVRDSKITHSQYAARRVKDAICDQFVDRVGRRPSVDVEEPMLGLNLHIWKNHATLSLDSSGDSLHKRGYRPIQTKAPLNEALAAAIVQRTGWRGEVPFVDPLCGSGTLPIEAGWLALDRPPGLTRRRFGFMGWMDYDVAEWATLRDEARQGVRKALPAPVWGADIRGDAVSFAISNARAAGIGHLVRFHKRDVRQWQPEGPPGVIVCNPPYGERIGDERQLVGLYRGLGELMGRAPGWSMWVFTGNPRLAEAIGLPPVEEVALFNGKIPCRLLRFTHSEGERGASAP